MDDEDHPSESDDDTESGEGKEAIGEDSSDDETAKTLTKKEEPKEEE